LAPAEVADKALFGDHAAVAGVQPVIAPRLGTGLGAAPVAPEQGRGTYAQPALAAPRQPRAGLEVADLELGAGYRQADEGGRGLQVEIVLLQPGGEGVAGMGFGHAEAGFEQGAAGQFTPATAVFRGQLLDEGHAAGDLQRTE